MTQPGGKEALRGREEKTQDCDGQKVHAGKESAGVQVYFKEHFNYKSEMCT